MKRWDGGGEEIKDTKIKWLLLTASRNLLPSDGDTNNAIILRMMMMKSPNGYYY
jgi:hypothetical protein